MEGRESSLALFLSRWIERKIDQKWSHLAGTKKKPKMLCLWVTISEGVVSSPVLPSVERGETHSV